MRSSSKTLLVNDYGSPHGTGTRICPSHGMRPSQSVATPADQGWGTVAGDALGGAIPRAKLATRLWAALT